MVLCEQENSLLVIVDMQQAFVPTMQAGVFDGVVKSCELLLQAANILSVPVLCTEQYPKGLGHTVSAIKVLLPAQTLVIGKSCFACSDSADFTNALAVVGREQVVLAGIESHVCILQTALKLRAAGKQVFVVEDACCSRDTSDHENAMRRLAYSDVVVTNSESVVFEWLADSGHERFGEISGVIKGQVV